MSRRHLTLAAVACGSLAALLGCATGPSDAEISARTAAAMKSSFNERGQAKLDRLDQDDTQKTCSEYAGKPLPAPVSERILAANLATIKWPADGKYLGDWKNGEKIAQALNRVPIWSAAVSRASWRSITGAASGRPAFNRSARASMPSRPRNSP